MIKIKYEEKLKCDNLNNYFALNEQKLAIYEIKHLKFDLLQLEAKRRGQLAGLTITCDKIKEVKKKIGVYAGRINFD